jgi:hypothetical protein
MARSRRTAGAGRPCPYLVPASSGSRAAHSYCEVCMFQPTLPSSPAPLIRHRARHCRFTFCVLACRHAAGGCAPGVRCFACKGAIPWNVHEHDPEPACCSPQAHLLGGCFRICRRWRPPMVDEELVGDESHVVGVENLPLLLRGPGATAVPIRAAAAVSSGCRKRRARERANGVLKLPPLLHGARLMSRIGSQKINWA